MEKKEGSLSTVFLVIAVILIVVMGALLYMQKTEADRQIVELENNASKLQETIDDLQGKIDAISNTINSNTSGEIGNLQSNNTVDNKNENIKVEIPEASTDISDKEGKIIDYFKGIWTTDNGEKLLVIDYGKRFCDISNNSKEYGRYTVKDGTASSVPTITLTYTSGKTLELELTQGSANYLMSNDRKVQYVEYEGYYFGASEGDEGIFNK